VPVAARTLLDAHPRRAFANVQLPIGPVDDRQVGDDAVHRRLPRQGKRAGFHDLGVALTVGVLHHHDDSAGAEDGGVDVPTAGHAEPPLRS
jgi:hypothetical protein